MPASICSALRILILVIAAAGWAAPKDKPPLKIDLPRTAAVVHPGETVTVVVSSPSGTASDVLVLGEGGMIGDAIARHLPARIRVSIPANMRPGTYGLSAVGKGPGKNEVVSDSIELDVELPNDDTPGANATGGARIEKIESEMDTVPLTSQGDQFPTEITATYSNGKQVDISNSSRLTFRSSDPTVATVDANHMVTAIGRGEAIITVIYQDEKRSFQCLVPVSVEETVVSTAPAVLDFGRNHSVPVGSSSTRQVVLTYNSTVNPAMRIVSITTAGDFFQTNNCFSSSETRNEKTCTVTVTFAPTISGKRIGELRLHTNWTNLPITVPLSGWAWSR